MPRNSEWYLGALDLGSQKIKAVIAKVRGDQQYEIIGYAMGNAYGIEKGQIIDFKNAARSIRNVIVEAQTMAGWEIEHLIVGIGGSHLKTTASNGSIKIADGVVNYQTIDALLESTLSYCNLPEQQLLHNLTERFTIDSQDSNATKTPFGLSGKRLDVTTTIVSTNFNAHQTIVRCLSDAGVKDFSIYALPISTSEAVLGLDDKELGACVLDIGAALTHVAVYAKGSLRRLATIPLGGNSITRDVALCAHIPSSESESIKLELSLKDRNLINPGDSIKLSTNRTVSPLKLLDVMDCRLREILDFVKGEIHQSGYEDIIGSGIMMVGGTCHYRNLIPIAEELFQQPARIVNQNFPQIEGQESIPHLHSFVQVLGLIAFYHQDNEQSHTRSANTGNSIISDFLTWLK